MGEREQREQGSLEDTVRRARDEMHAATESLRALLAELLGGEELAPTDARSPGSAPSP